MTAPADPPNDPHCATCRCGERFPVQAEWDRDPQIRRAPGTVAWWEAEEAYAAYAAQYGTSQSLPELGRRHGFGYREISGLLGHEPTTWRVVGVS